MLLVICVEKKITHSFVTILLRPTNAGNSDFSDKNEGVLGESRKE
jgi:hypothetical protein